MKYAAAFFLGACLASSLILGALASAFPHLFKAAVGAALLVIPAILWYLLEQQIEENKNART